MEGVCVFATLYDENICIIKDDNLGCQGKIEKCPILELREREMDIMFSEMESIEEKK